MVLGMVGWSVQRDWAGKRIILSQCGVRLEETGKDGRGGWGGRGRRFGDGDGQ